MAQQRQPEREPRRERMEVPMQQYEQRWTEAGPIRPVGPEERIEELELGASATVADAAPLGLAAFAATTFTLGAIEAGWGGMSVVGFIATIPMLIVFGGIAQFIAAMWAFRKGSTFWATFLGVFGSLYAVLGLGAIVVGTTGIPVGIVSPDAGTGVAVAMFAFIALYLTWAAMGVSSIMVGVTGFLTVSLALLSVVFFVGGAPIVLMVAGYTAIISGLLAFYGSAAIVVNSTLRRETLPY